LATPRPQAADRFALALRVSRCGNRVRSFMYVSYLSPDGETWSRQASSRDAAKL